MPWPESTIQSRQGVRPAVAPLIISASRATDIPAFHPLWFMNRIRAGYCLWQNPFHAGQRQYISFEQCKVFVFWSKNPQMLMPHLAEIEERGYQYYFHYTLNDYEQEGLEARLPDLEQRVAVFQQLSERIGRHRVIWRFDPIIMGHSLTAESILERISRLAERLAPYTEKLVFSFVDWYKKTARAMHRFDPLLRPPTEEEIQQLACGIAAINQRLPSPLVLATCAEAANLHTLGIAHNRCVDPELLLRLCPESQKIRALCAQACKAEQGALLPLAPGIRKDKGQRALCGCIPSKDIGTYNTCMHFCEYCYANHSQGAVMQNMKQSDSNSEILAPEAAALPYSSTQKAAPEQAFAPMRLLPYGR